MRFRVWKKTSGLRFRKPPKLARVNWAKPCRLFKLRLFIYLFIIMYKHVTFVCICVFVNEGVAGHRDL